MPDTKQAGTERLECIGIAGSGPSVGVTHFSLMTAAKDIPDGKKKGKTGYRRGRTAV